MAYQSSFTGQEVENAITKLRNWISGSVDSSANIFNITISGSTYAVLWKVAPTSSNQVYGIGLNASTGRIYQIYNNKGTYSAVALDSNSDTKNTAGSDNTTSKLYLVGPTSQTTYAITYSNSNVYTENGNLYATAMYASNKLVATQEWVTGKNYVTGVTPTIKYLNISYTAGTAITGGTTKYAHPSFTGTAATSTAPNTGGTATVASTSHTHSVTAAGSVALGQNTTSTNGVPHLTDVSATTKKLSASTSAHAAAGNASVASSAHTHDVTINTYSLNGSNSSHTVKYAKFSAGTTPKSGATPNQTSTATGADSGNGTAVASSGHSHTITLTANTATADGRITYLQSHTAASLGTPSTSSAAPNAHTHTFSGSVALTRGTAPSLTDQTTETVGISGGSGKLEAYDAATNGTKKVADGTRIPFITSFSAGTTPPKSASFTGTEATITPTLGGTTTFVTDYPNFSGGSLSGTTTFLTAAIKSASLSASRSTSGSGASARRTLTLSVTTANADSTGTVGFTAATLGTASTGTVTITGASYTPEGSVGLTAGTAPSATKWYLAHGHTGASLTGTTTFVTDRGTFSAGTTPVSSASCSGTTDANSGDAIAAVTGYPNFSGGSAATRYLSAGTGSASGTTTVASHTHTHNYDKTTSVSLTAGTAPSMNWNTGTTTDTPYVASATNSSLSLGSGTASATTGGPSGTTNVSGTGHTHTVSLDGNASSGVSYVTGLEKTTKYFHPSFTGSAVTTGSPSGEATVASSSHTHNVTATGGVSLGLNDTASGGTALITGLSSGSVGGSASLTNTGSSGTKVTEDITVNK